MMKQKVFLVEAAGDIARLNDELELGWRVTNMQVGGDAALVVLEKQADNVEPQPLEDKLFLAVEFSWSNNHSPVTLIVQGWEAVHDILRAHCLTHQHATVWELNDQLKLVSLAAQATREAGYAEWHVKRTTTAHSTQAQPGDYEVWPAESRRK